MNDLLSRLDASAQSPAPRRTNTRDSWVVTFCATSSARLLRDFGPMLAMLDIEGFQIHVLAPDDGGLLELQDQGCHIKAIPNLERAYPNPAAWLGVLIILQAHLIEHPSALLYTQGMGLGVCGELARLQGEALTHVAHVEDHRWLTEQSCGSALAPAPQRALTSALQAARLPLAGGLHALWRWLGERADAYVISSREDLKLLESLELIAPQKIEILPGSQGVEFTLFDPESALVPAQKIARAQLQVPDSWRQLIGVSGQLEAPEELAAMVRALALRAPQVGWLIATPAGGLSKRAARALKPLVAKNLVMFTQPALNMPRFYAALDIFCSPRHGEGVATSVLEAGAMRLPVVAYRTHGSQAIIEPGESGILCEPGDMAGMVEALSLLVDEPARRARYGARARTMMRQKFSRHAAHQQLLGLFDRVIKRKL